MAKGSRSSDPVFDEEPVAQDPPRALTTALPDNAPQLTAKRAFLGRSVDPVVASFLHTEVLNKSIRKMSREQWLVELDRFTKAPR